MPDWWALWKAQLSILILKGKGTETKHYINEPATVNDLHRKKNAG